MGVQNLDANGKNLQDYIRDIAVSAENLYSSSGTSVSLDDPAFISTILDGTLGSSVGNDIKADLKNALGNSLYMLQVKDNSAATTGIQNFMFTTLQSDLTKIKQADAAAINSYTNDIFSYVATDQNLSLSDVNVAIVVNDDVFTIDEDSSLTITLNSLLSNDTYLRGAKINIQNYPQVSYGDWQNTSGWGLGEVAPGENPENTYTPKLNFSGTDSFVYTLDQGGQSSSATVTITVNPVNDLPILSGINNSYQTSLEYGSQAIGTIGVSDVDSDNFTYSISGEDASLFSIDSNGKISFNSAATDARTYKIAVQVSDGIATVTQELEITVNPRDPNTTYTGVTSGFETFTGGSGDDTFNPGDGDARIDGGTYNDEVIFFSPRSEARIITLSGVTRVFFDCFSSYTGENKCQDYYITNVETLSFSDASVSLETALPASLISGSTTGNETLSGNSSDNVFDPGDGDATIDGGAGTDEVLFFSPRSEATITTISGISKITFDCFSSYTGENKCHTFDLTNIEIVTFSDQSINLNAGWKQLGTDIDGLSQGDNSGYAVDISVGEVHGIIVAIGSPGASSDSSSSAWGSVRVLRKINANADWEQFGYFEGEGAGDQFGRSVKLSADGTIIAIGGPNNDPTDVSDNAAGHVRVFQWIGGDQWTQLGTDIDGENQGDQSGDRIALSADGTILAVAEHLYLDNTGRVRIYRYENNTDWVLLGSPIIGEAKGDFFGTGLAINSSGTRVAIGARANDSSALNGGEVKVYEFSDQWVQLGSDISDFVSPNDSLGFGVSMNSAGDVVAAAAPQGTPKGELSGYVRVYRYTSAGEWSRSFIDGDKSFDQQSSEGRHIDLSGDGNRIIIGASGSDRNGDMSGTTKIFDFNSSGNNWISVGEEILGEAAKDRGGFSTAITSDGNKIIIGALCNDGDTNNNVDCRGHARVYEYIE